MIYGDLSISIGYGKAFGKRGRYNGNHSTDFHRYVCHMGA